MNTLIKVSENMIIDVDSGMVAEIGNAIASNGENYHYLGINYPFTTKRAQHDYREYDYISLTGERAVKLFRYLCDNAYDICDEKKG